MIFAQLIIYHLIYLLFICYLFLYSIIYLLLIYLILYSQIHSISYYLQYSLSIYLKSPYFPILSCSSLSIYYHSPSILHSNLLIILSLILNIFTPLIHTIHLNLISFILSFITILLQVLILFFYITLHNPSHLAFQSLYHSFIQIPLLSFLNYFFSTSIFDQNVDYKIYYCFFQIFFQYICFFGQNWFTIDNLNFFINNEI